MRVMMAYELFSMWQKLGASSSLMCRHHSHHHPPTHSYMRLFRSLYIRWEQWLLCLWISPRFRWQQAPLHPRNDGTLPGSHPRPSNGGSKHNDPNFPRHDGLGAEEKRQLQTGHYHFLVECRLCAAVVVVIKTDSFLSHTVTYPIFWAECVCMCVGGSRADG